MKEITRRSLALFLSLVMALDMVMPVWAEETNVPELPVVITDECDDDDCDCCKHDHELHHDDEIEEESKEVITQIAKVEVQAKVEELEKVELIEEPVADEVKESEKEKGLLEKIGDEITNVVDGVIDGVKKIANLFSNDDKEDDEEDDLEITGEVEEIPDEEIPVAFAALAAPMLMSNLLGGTNSQKDTTWAVDKKDKSGHTVHPNLNDCTAKVTCVNGRTGTNHTAQWFTSHNFPEGECGETVECTRCNQTKTYEHVYTNSYEPDTATQHLKYCDICRKAVKENHRFGNAQKYDCTKHKLVCQDCGYVKYVEHTMVNKGSYQQCSVCGAKSTESNFHNYQFDVNGAITYDYHTLKCTGCGATITEEHDLPEARWVGILIFGYWEFPDPAECPTCGVHQYCRNNATHRFIADNTDCTNAVYCLATLKDPHDDEYCSEPDVTFNRGAHEFVYSNKTKTTHDKTCQYCTIEKVTEPHVYDQKGGTECICGYKKPACEHTWTYEKYNATQHKYICSKDCGADGYENHTWDDGVITTSPTCTAPGVKTYTCTKCSETKTEPVSALGHDIEHHAAKAPTCTEIGWEAYDTCSRCNYTTYEEIKALGHLHEDANWEEVKAATCTEKGQEKNLCSRCGEKDITYRDIEAKRHKWEDIALKAATCTEDGYSAYRKCSVCEAEEGKQTLTKLGHDYKSVVTEPTCLEGGYTTHTCSRCNDSYTDGETNPLGHDVKVDEAVNADCTHTGLTEGSHCERCKAILVAQTETKALGHLHEDANWEEVKAATCTEKGKEKNLCSRCGEEDITYRDIEAKGHKWEDIALKAATCTEDGYSAYRKCSVCEAEEGKQTLTKLGHDYKSVVTEPTCLEGGYTTHTCSRCNDSYTDGETNPLGHDVKVDEAVNADCTHTGLTEGSHCERCKAILVAQTKTQALGHLHEDANWEEVKAATCTEKGKEKNLCSRCGEKDITYRDIEAKGHKWEDIALKAATCTEDGYSAYRKCSVCEAEEGKQTLSKLGHDYKSVVTEPTCLEGGYTTHTCSRCKDSYTDGETQALGHDYDSVVTEPTCLERGYTTHTCKNCSEGTEGHSYVDSYTNALGHDLVEDTNYPSTYTPVGVSTHTRQYRVRCTREGCSHTESASETLVHNFKEVPGTSEYIAIEGNQNTHKHTYKVQCEQCNIEDTREGYLAHTWEEPVVVPATCTADGYTLHKCSGCGYEYKDNTVPATGHDMVETSGTSTYEVTEDGHIRHYETHCTHVGCNETGVGQVTEEHTYSNFMLKVAPTCVTEGRRERECRYCSHIDPETIKATGHDYAKVVTNPTCEEQGYTTYTCKNCSEGTEGHSYVADYTDPLGHDWNKGEVTTVPTCTEKGVMTYTCERCQITRTEDIDEDPDNHKASEEYTDEESIVPSTCTVKGHHDVITTCERCQEELSRRQVEDELLAHTPGEAHEEDRVEATCTVDGSYNWVVRCTVCNNIVSTETKTIPATDHAWDEGEVTTAPTCTKEGVRTFHCTNEGCKETKTEKVAVDRDNHTVVIDAAKMATCTVDGLTLGSHCSECQSVLVKQEVVPALGHKWNDGKVTKEATCTEEGNTHFECKACHTTKDEPIEKLDHKWYVYKTKDTPQGLKYYNGKSYSHTHSEYFKCEDCGKVRSQYTNTIVKCTPSEIVIENIKEGTATEAGSHDEVKYCTECKQEVYRQTVEDKLALKVLEAIAEETFDKTYDGNNKVLFDGEESTVITVKDDNDNDVKVKVTGTYDDSLPGDRKVDLIIEVISDTPVVFPRYEVKDIEGTINPIKIYSTFDDIQLPKNMLEKAQVVKEIDKVIKPYDEDIKALDIKDLSIKDANYEVAPCEKYGVKHQAQVVIDGTLKDSEGNEIVVVRKIIDGNVIYNKSNRNKKKDKGSDDEVVELDDELIARGLDFEYIDLPKNVETPSDWAKADVYDLTEKGIVNGYEDMTYRPNNLIRRDEFSKLAYMVLSLKENEDGTSKDFEDTVDNWAREMIRIATTVDVLRGYDDVTFGPADNITNEQMMAILVRGMKYLGKDIRVTDDEEADKELAKVIDGDQVSDWAKLDAATAIKYGLFIGDENKAVKPLGSTTRAQVAVILVRYMNLISELVK